MRVLLIIVLVSVHCFCVATTKEEEPQRCDWEDDIADKSVMSALVVGGTGAIGTAGCCTVLPIGDALHRCHAPL